MNKLFRKHWFILAIIFLVVGCKSIGPGRLEMDRGTYNAAVGRTELEQLLLNIVRGRYLEVTNYIQISSLTASYSLSESLAGDINAGLRPGPVNLSSSLTPSVNYSDSPTISYVPLSSNDFAESLMTPITMTHFLLLAHSGGFDNIVLIRLFFERLNDLDSNLINRQGTYYSTIEFRKFNHLMNLLIRLNEKNAFEIPKPVLYNKTLGLMLVFRPALVKSADAIQFKKILNVAPNSKSIVFIEHTFDEDLHKENGLLVLDSQKSPVHNIVYVRFRSLLSAIHMLGFGVQVPEKDILAHKTRESILLNGSRYDWRRKMKGILTIYSSDEEPRVSVLVKVYTHKHWFYIKSSDAISKDTFVAMIRLFTLTSAFENTAPSNNPLLTIPVQKAN